MGKKLLFYFLGIMIACLGVTFIIKANIGAGPWDIVNVGLTEKIGFTLGTWVIISQALFLFINAILLNKRPEFESVITILIWGLAVDFWMKIVFENWDPVNYALLMKWGIFLLGITLIGMGVGIYLTSNLPKMPYDGTMVAISSKFNVSLNISRTILEGSAFILSFFVGGSIGIGLGTVVILLVIGHIVQFFHKLSFLVYNSKISFFV